MPRRCALDQPSPKAKAIDGHGVAPLEARLKANDRREVSCELSSKQTITSSGGGPYWTRTSDLFHVKETL